MKAKLLKILTSSVLLAAALTGCSNGETGENVLSQTKLEAPADVKVVEGTDTFSSSDDKVTFSAVEHATKYYCYVFQTGDTQAKVTTTTTTEAELPSGLTAGTYSVRVVAVGDGVNYKNSNGSAAISYTLAEAVTTPLTTVSNAAMDWTKYQLTFTGDAKASEYSVVCYKSDANKTKGDLVTNFLVPGSDTAAVSYDISTTVSADLTPGYYIFDITAKGSEENYTSDSATFSQHFINGGYTLKTPEASFAEQDAGGYKVTVTNAAASFSYGQQFTVQFYSDEACTTLVKSTDFTYTAKTMPWGSDVDNTTIEVKDTAAAATDLVVGTTYYARVAIEADGVIYLSSVYSAVAAITPTKAGTGSSGGGGWPGGGW